jgi:hypothetical protein
MIMTRNLLSQLTARKSTPADGTSSRALLLYGIKGVGKTTLALDFAKTAYENHIYINFETDNAAKKVFASVAADQGTPSVDLRPGHDTGSSDKLKHKAHTSESAGDSFLHGLSVYLGLEVQAVTNYLSRDTLVVIDEPDAAPDCFDAVLGFCVGKFAAQVVAITSSMTRFEHESQSHITHIGCRASHQEAKNATCAESNALDRPKPISDLIYDLVQVAPLTFDEFLDASGEGWQLPILRSHVQTRRPLPDTLHREMTALFEEYLQTGGMPAVLNEYFQADHPENYAEIQSAICQRTTAYIQDAYGENGYKMQQLLQAVKTSMHDRPERFRFNSIRTGCTHKMYAHALEVLLADGYLNQYHFGGNAVGYGLSAADVTFSTPGGTLYNASNHLLQMAATYGLSVTFESGRSKIAQKGSVSGYEPYWTSAFTLVNRIGTSASGVVFSPSNIQFNETIASYPFYTIFAVFENYRTIFS